MRTSFIGVDFDPRCLRAAQVTRARGRWQVTAASRARRRGDEEIPTVDELAAFRGTLARQGMAGRRIVLGVPARHLLTAVVDVPARSSGAPVDAIARAELAAMHSCEPTTLEAVCWELPETASERPTNQAMTMACPHGVSDPLLDAFEAAGFDVMALDGPLQAAVRTCRERLRPDAVTCFLHVGWDTTAMSLVFCGRVVYHRLIPQMGVGAAADRLADDLGLDDAVLSRLLSGGQADDPDERELRDELAKALRPTWRSILTETEAPLAYVAHQYPDAAVHEVLVTGYGAADSAGAADMAERLGRSVRPVCVAEVADLPAHLTDWAHDTSLPCAIGLAQYGTGPRT